MIDHVSIAVADLTASGAFYDAVLRTLGLERLVTRECAIGFGKKYPEFWLNARAKLHPADKSTGNHVCLRAPSREAVLAFHRVALEQGGSDGGAPGNRQATVTACFNAFIHDPEGNRIEAVTFP